MADDKAPIVVNFSPADEANFIGISADIVLNFNEPVQRGAGDILLRTGSGALVARYNIAASASVSVSGSTLRINPTSDLAYSTKYLVELPAGSIKDMAGNGYSGTKDYNFTTGAITAKELWTYQKSDTVGLNSLITGRDGKLYAVGDREYGSGDADIEIIKLDTELIKKYTGDGVLRDITPIIWREVFGSPKVRDRAAGVGEGAQDVLYVASRFPPSIAKYDLDGTLISIDAARPGSYAQFAAKTAADGSLYVCGQTTSSIDGQILIGSVDGFLSRYGSNGRLIWTRLLGGPGADVARNLAIGSDDAIYVTGETQSSTFNDDVTPNRPGTYDSTGYLSKYSAADGAILWNKMLVPGSGSSKQSIAISADGSIYVTGTIQTTTSWLGNSQVPARYAFLSKYSSDGEELWTRRLGMSEAKSVLFDTSAEAIAIGRDGSIYIGGTVTGALPGKTFWGGGGDGYISKYNASGERLWDQTIATIGGDGVTALAIGLDGSLYVAGDTGGSLDGFSQGGYFIKKFSDIGLTSPIFPVNEGETVEFTLFAEAATVGTSVPYALIGTGITPQDFSDEMMSGFASFGTGGVAKIFVPIKADGNTEGVETLTLVSNGLSSSVTITDSSTDQSPPVISILTGPYQGWNGRDYGNQVKIIFNEPVQLGLGFIVLKDSADKVVGSYDVVSSKDLWVSSDGTFLEVNVGPSLGYNVEYKIVFDHGSVKDTSGNIFLGTSGYSFTTGAVDDQSPTVLTFSPADEAKAVAIGANVLVTFSENIQRGTDNITLKKADGTTVATYRSSSADVTVVGRTLAINPASDLAFGTGYKVEFAAGSVQDLAGNNYAGTTSYNFTTNFIPTATTSNLLTNEDVAVNNTLTGIDKDEQSLTFVKVTDPSHGLLSINPNTGAFEYVPNANYSGSDNFSFKVNDGQVDSSAATVWITVRPVNDSPAGAVFISGNPMQTGTLRADNTLVDWDGIPGAGPGALKYQWLADGDILTGEVSRTLNLTQRLVGKAISVIATYIDNGGVLESVSSLATTPIENVNDAATGTITVAGYPGRGLTVRAVVTGLVDPDGLPTGEVPLMYEWRVDGSVIIGANGPELLLLPDYTGKTISVALSFEDATGVRETLSSILAGPVMAASVDASVLYWSDLTPIVNVTTSLYRAAGKPGAAPSYRTVSDGSGSWALDDLNFDSHISELARTVTVSDRDSITAADVLAALKLSSGRSPNPDPDGPGTQTPKGVSSWQLLAADIDGDGRVTRSDAYSLLKAAAGAVRAPITRWIFTDESIGSSNATRDNVPTPMPTEISLQAHTDMRWLGVLLGDVDGSWGGGQAT